MTIVRSARCCGITTCRTPGVWSAVDTGSPDELLDELLLLPPHAASPTASAHAAPIEPVPRNILPKVIASPPSCLPDSSPFLPHRRRRKRIGTSPPVRPQPADRQPSHA